MVAPPRLDSPAKIPTPALLIDRARVRRNLERMIEMAGGTDRLRPHVKTHKMPAVVRLSATFGISRYKVATIAEAEMVASAGGNDVLLAYPMVGPNIARMARLLKAYPSTTFRAVVDDPSMLEALSEAVREGGRALPVLIDLDVGMGRTGIAPGEAAEALYRKLATLPGLKPDGIHAYDGHIRDADPVARKESARPGIEATLQLRDRLLAAGLPVPRLVMGGTPSFPIHAAGGIPGVECSPGTCVFHDAGYASTYADLPFEPAAYILTRVVSRPGPNRLCFDCGSKSIAADPPAERRVALPDLPGAIFRGQSEEHYVVEVDPETAGRFPPGTPTMALPWHICPTSALHRTALVVEDGAVVDHWDVTARDRMLGV
ncbi:MAG: D-TA family PLP-dependent enzyme [Isosphaeraceae bacterium]